MMDDGVQQFFEEADAIDAERLKDQEEKVTLNDEIQYLKFGHCTVVLIIINEMYVWGFVLCIFNVRCRARI